MNSSETKMVVPTKKSQSNLLSEMNLKMLNINSKSFENDSNHKLLMNEMELKILNCDELYERLNDIIFKEKTPQNLMTQQSEFDRTQYASRESYLEFYMKLNNYKKFIRKGTLVTKTPSFNFIEAVEKNNIIPNPIGLLKRQGNPERINLKHYGKGDSHVKAITNSIKIADHVTEIDLQDNRLTNSSVIPMMETLKSNVKFVKNLSLINLSYNKLGKEAIDSLCLFIQEPDCELSHINLEANCLGNDVVISLVNTICVYINHKLKYINLGQNNLNDLCAFGLANLVEKCVFLKVLILYWNSIRNHGASMIVNKMKKHFELKFFDISWNLIGNSLLDSVPSKEELEKSNKESKNFVNAELNEIRSMDFTPFKKKLNPLKSSISPFAKELGELFKEKSSELIHLDFSHNNIGYADSVHISEEVKNNHIILGIHCDGNELMIDELGFMEAINKTNFETSHYAHSQIFYKISEEHPLIKTNILNVRKIRAKNNCWICEGWRETKFVYNIKQNIEERYDEPPVVKLHLSFENYKPYDTIPKGDHFVCHRMCPPGEFLFYFTVNGVPVENCGQITHKLKEAIIHQEKDTEGEVKEYIITKLAKSVAEINPHVIDSDNYRKMIQYCEPRPEKKIIQKVRPRTPWSFPISIWAIYDISFEGESEVRLKWGKF